MGALPAVTGGVDSYIGAVPNVYFWGGGKCVLWSEKFGICVARKQSYVSFLNCPWNIMSRSFLGGRLSPIEYSFYGAVKCNVLLAYVAYAAAVFIIDHDGEEDQEDFPSTRGEK